VGQWHFAVVRPPAGLSTADVYRACRPAQARRPVEPLVAALRRGDAAEAGRRMHNRLEEAAAGLCDWIGRLKREFEKCGCAGHQLSGSGTCYFGLCRSAAHARRVASVLAGRGVGRVYAVRSCP
jgi:4-diphosphocytidyl-2-C-methyl-D-erythritol kinase